MNHRIVFIVASIALHFSNAPAQTPDSAASQSTKFLLLDSRIVESTENAKLSVGEVTKFDGNPLFKEDKPWEVRFDNLYANVVYDEEDKTYKCWYSPFIRDPSVTDTPLEQRGQVRYQPHDRVMGVCYATSKDGIHWEKPSMDVREYDGQQSNLVEIGPHGAGIFKDLHDTDPERRYKMFFNEDVMRVAFSPDGVHWREPVACPQIEAAGDTHNNALWVPELNRYVGITRLWNKVRQVGRTESEDFVHWSKAQVVLQGLEEHLQTYAMPVFRYAARQRDGGGGVYLGLPVIFDTTTDRSHTELAWSPDTITWNRIDPGAPLIPNAQEPGAYDWGCVYAAAYPVFLKDEIRLYYGGSNGPHTNWRDGFFCLATLRPDGFAGYESTEGQTATVTTVPLACQWNTLRITADIQEGGSLGAALLDPTGTPIAELEPITQTATDTPVQWRQSPQFSDSSPRELRLRFTLDRAKLYAFSCITHPKPHSPN